MTDGRYILRDATRSIKILYTQWPCRYYIMACRLPWTTFQPSTAIFCHKVVHKFGCLHVMGRVKHFILNSLQIWSKVKNLCYVVPLFHWLMPTCKQNYGRPYRSEHLFFTNQIMHHLSSLILHATFTQCKSAECLSLSDNWCYLLSV